MRQLDLGLGFRRVSRVVLVAGVCLLPLAGCGGDQAARQKEAEAIAKSIEDYLATITDPGQKAGLHHDKVTVTASDSDKSFAVAVTGIKFADVGSGGLNLGEIDYRLTPADADTYQVSDLKMPQEFSLLGDDGKPAATVKFETTSFSGVWSKPLQNFLKLDWQAKNLAVIDAAAPDVTAGAETVALTIDGKDNGKGRLDQASHITVSGVTLAAPSEDMAFKLAKLTGSLDIQGFDFAGYRTQMLRLRDLTAKFAPGLAAQAEAGASGSTAAPPAAPAPVMTDDDRKALAEIVAALPKTMSGYSYGFSAEGLTGTAKDGSVPVRLAQGGMDFALKGLDGDKAEFDLGVKHDGLELSGAAFDDPMAKAVLPKSGNLALVATEIPVASLVDAIAKQIPDLTSNDPATAKGAQFAMMGTLMSALSQSKINLRIDPSRLTSERAALTADGALQLAMNSPAFAVGTVNLALVGLDDLMSLAGGLAQQSPDAAQAVGMLQMLQALAKRETGADGKPVDKFVLDFGQTGAITVNGKPLDGIMQ